MNSRNRSVIKVLLPIPHKVLRPNGRTFSYGYRAKLVKQHRLAAMYAAINELNEMEVCFDLGLPWRGATVSSQWAVCAKWDQDNAIASLKPYLDGLADAGIVSNDRDFTVLPPEMVVSRKMDTGIWITIQKCEE